MKRYRLKPSERLLVATPILLLIVPILSSLKLQNTEFDEAMKRISGRNAVYLGEDNMWHGTRLFAAVKGRKPFYANLGRKGSLFDDQMGMVMSPEGALYDLYWEHGGWFSKGRMSVAHVHNLKLRSDGSIQFGGGGALTSIEKARLLNK